MLDTPEIEAVVPDPKVVYAKVGVPVMVVAGSQLLVAGNHLLEMVVAGSQMLVAGNPLL